MSDFLSPLTPPSSETPDLTQPGPVDFSAIGQALASGAVSAGAFEHMAASGLAALSDGLSAILAWMCTEFTKAAADVASGGGPNLAQLTCIVNASEAVIVSLMTNAQSQNTPGFYLLVSKLLSDLLGVDVPAASATPISQGGAPTGAMAQVGGALINQLISEFVPSGTLDPTKGLDALNAFMGFVISFSVREANTTFWSDLIAPERLESIRDLCVETAQNVGLGRLSRLALRPIVQILGVTPATWQLNAQYRPTRLKDVDLVELLRRGLVTQQQFTSEMQYLGYRDTDTAALLGKLAHPLAPAGLMEKILAGATDLPGAVAYLQAYGYTPQEANDAMGAADFQRVQVHWQAILAQLISDVVAGKLPLQYAIGVPTVVQSGISGQLSAPVTQWGGMLALLPFSDEERNVIGNYLIWTMSNPGTLLTETELTDSLTNGFITLVDWVNGMARYRYSPDQLNVLQETALLKLATGKTVAKALNITLADAKTALAEGIWTTKTFGDYLQTVGYTVNAINTLHLIYDQTYQTKAPTAATAATVAAAGTALTTPAP